MSNPVNPIAAVCGNEVRIYGPAVPGKKGLFRRLWSVVVRPHHGSALEYAREYDEKRNSKNQESAEVRDDKRRRRNLL